MVQTLAWDGGDAYAEPMLISQADVPRLLEWIANAPAVGYDSEWGGGAHTVEKKRRKGEAKTNLSIHPDLARMAGFSVAFPNGKSFYVPVGHIGKCGINVPQWDARRLLEAIADKAAYAWNWKGDMRLLRSMGIQPKLPLDGMVAAYLLYGPGGLSLDAQARSLGMEKGDFAATLDGRDPLLVPPAEMAPYAAKDAWLALTIGNRHAYAIQEAKMGQVFQLEMDLIEVLLRHEDLGIGVDLTALDVLRSEADRREEQALAEWQKLCPWISPSSPTQLRELYAMGIWDPSVADRSPTGLLKVSADCLEAQEVRLPEGSLGRRLAALALEIREAHKIRTTYAEPLMGYASAFWDGRAHPKFNQTVTATMRLSSSEPNFQNFAKRGELAARLRSCFVAPDGYVFIVADFSQIELCCAAQLCGGYLMEAVRARRDLHAATGEQAGVSRDIGKTLNFATLFGAGPRTLARKAGASMEQAKEWIREFDRKAPEIRRWKERNVRRCAKDGYVRTLLGHRRPVDAELLSIDEDKMRYGDPRRLALWREQRICNNTPIQGLAAGIQKRAAVMLLREGPERFVGQIHDSAIFEVPERDALQASCQIREIMEAASVPEMDVPVRVDIEVGKTWADMEALK